MSGSKVDFPPVQPQDVKNLIKRVGYEIVREEGDVFIVQDESKISIYCCVQENVLTCSVPCHKVKDKALTADVMRRMLDADNGITTSSFRLAKASKGQSQILLTNVCKLQELGADDADDIWSALNFLEIDVVKARDILKDIL